jgi:hypothetical protein
MSWTAGLLSASPQVVELNKMAAILDGLPIASGSLASFISSAD